MPLRLRRRRAELEPYRRRRVAQERAPRLAEVAHGGGLAAVGVEDLAQLLAPQAHALLVDEGAPAGNEGVVVERSDLLARFGVEVLVAEAAPQRPRLGRVVVDELRQGRARPRLVIGGFEAGIDHPAHISAVLDAVLLAPREARELDGGGRLGGLERRQQLLHPRPLRLRGDLGELLVLGGLGGGQVLAFGGLLELLAQRREPHGDGARAQLGAVGQRVGGAELLAFVVGEHRPALIGDELAAAVLANRALVVARQPTELLFAELPHQLADAPVLAVAELRLFVEDGQHARVLRLTAALDLAFGSSLKTEALLRAQARGVPGGQRLERLVHRGRRATERQQQVNGQKRRDEAERQRRPPQEAALLAEVGQGVGRGVQDRIFCRFHAEAPYEARLAIFPRAFNDAASRGASYARRVRQCLRQSWRTLRQWRPRVRVRAASRPAAPPARTRSSPAR